MSKNRTERPAELSQMDIWALAGIGILGGGATAMFSVGVGELMALYLFLRRFPLEVCVPPAVIVSALSVLSGTPYHLFNGDLVFEILVFAAPAVMLGGFLARRLAHLRREHSLGRPELPRPVRGARASARVSHPRRMSRESEASRKEARNAKWPPPKWH